MSKALIIKGADFSANYVTRITIASVPCTGIQFAQSEITSSSGETATVEYTVTPQDTTDPVVWTSSDTDVVTVNRGVLTVVGIGTATITATCGNYSASAEVTTSVEYIPNWKFKYLSKAGTVDFVSNSIVSSNKFICPFGSGSQTCEYTIIGSNNAGHESPVKIPKGTKKIRISRGADYGALFYGDSRIIYWLRDISCGDSNYPNGALYVGQSNTANFKTTATVDVDIPTDLGEIDCFAISFQFNNTPADVSDPNGLAEGYGMSVEFLPAS